MARRKPRQPGWWIPWTFVGCFIVVVAVNAGMVTAALTSFTGLDTANYYRRGLAYNKDLEAQAEQQRRGWKASLRFVQTERRKGRLIATFADRAGVGLLSLEVEARIVRPTDAHDDFEVVFKPLGDGRYATDIDFPLAGQWRAEVLAWRGAAQHRLKQRFIVK
jgi:nitrogen fixation protein FixH